MPEPNVAENTAKETEAYNPYQANLNPPLVEGSGLLELENGEQLVQGGLWRRLLARLIDYTILWVVLFEVYYFVAGVEIEAAIFVGIIPLTDDVWVTLVTAPVVLLYEAFAIGYKGQTIGKLAVKIRVAQVADGSHPDYLMAIKRWIPYGVAGFGASLLSHLDNAAAFPPIFALWGFVILIFISPILDTQRRGWHDRIAHTAVVRHK